MNVLGHRSVRCQTFRRVVTRAIAPAAYEARLEVVRSCPRALRTRSLPYCTAVAYRRRLREVPREARLGGKQRSL